jgi:hypothetical protein
MGHVEVSFRVRFLLLVLAGFLVRAYPHLLLVDRWIIEEPYNYVTVLDLINTGTTPQAGFYPMLEHQLIWVAWLLTRIDPVTLCQYANPMFGALAAIPLYYLLRERFTESQALIGVTLWVFSDAAYYRSSYFGSTEPLSWLFALSALALYRRRRWLPTVALLALAGLTHLLPTAYALAVVYLDRMLVLPNRWRAVLGLSVVALVAAFYSPLNPHQRIVSTLNPVSLLKGFILSNIGIYSLQELGLGLTIFGGFVALGLAAALGRLRTRDRLMDVMGLVAGAVFVFSWLDYQPNVFAPPRLTFYFVVPFIYYALRVISGRTALIFAGVSVVALIGGTPMMLMTDVAVTDEEYAALGELSEMGLISDLGWWFSDYPVTTSLALYASNVKLWDIDTSTLGLIQRTEKIRNLTTSPIFVYPYQYVFISERMTSGRAYLLVNTDGRTGRVTTTISDIWAGHPAWRLVYEGHGVKVYHYEEKI